MAALALAWPMHAGAAGYDSVVVINEVNYHPAAAGEAEWIELRNLQGVDMNLSKWSLAGGISFTFPADLTVPGGGYLVIAGATGKIPGASGPFTGSLNNSGDTIRLLNQNGRIMDELNYQDGGDWPVGPDGTGVTLSRRKASAGDAPGQWTSSHEIGGTPGRHNFAEPQTLPARVRLVGTNATWSFLDTGATPPADWKSAGFDASTWSAGPGIFMSPEASADAMQPVLSAPSTSLTGWWALKETTGTTAPNGVTTRPAGTLQNGVTWVNDPVRGQVAEFDGVDDRIDISTAYMPTQTLVTDFTWVCWMKSAASTTIDTPEDPQDGPLQQGASILMGNRTKFDGTGSYSPLQYTKLMPTGLEFARSNVVEPLTFKTPVNDTTTWHHVAVVKKGTLFTSYLDGIANGTRTITAAQSSGMPLFLGGDPLNPAECFKGRLSDAAVWVKALPARAIAGMARGLYTPATAPTTEATTTPPRPPLTIPIVATTVRSGPEPRYFRTSFRFDGIPSRASLELWAAADDGAIYYLNGVEIHRTNTPVTTTISNAAFPTTAVALPGTALLRGTNVLAVEIAQSEGTPDLLFAADLVSLETAGVPADANPSLAFSEISGSAQPPFRIELINQSAAPLDTNGWQIRDSKGASAPLPAQTVAPGARFVLEGASPGLTLTDGTRLALVRPNGYEVEDSRVITARLRGLTADGVWGHPDAPSFGDQNPVTVSDAIVINEIFHKSRDNSPEQWLELCNKSAAAVDLSGWKFSDGIGYTFPPGTSMAAGAYLILAWDPAAFTVLHPGIPALGPWSGNLSGKGELLRLRDANDNIVDEVPYDDSGRWPIWADGGGSSLELKDPRSDNSKGESWDASDESSRGKWETITYEGRATVANSDPTDYNEFDTGLLTAGDVLIDDVSVTETTTTNVRREVLQNGSFSSGLATAWRFLGNHRASAVVSDPDDPSNKVLRLSANGPTEHMSNHAETTFKVGTSFVPINPASNYRISLRARWLRGSNQLNTRLWVNRIPRTTILSAPNNGGTPGAVNSRYLANAGPTFSGLNHRPVVPPANTAATVSVNVFDPDGLASVNLFTSVNGAAFTSVPMTAATREAPYTAVVPARPASNKVQFYVQATDSLGASSFYPAAGPASRAIIPWADGASQFQLSTGARPHNLRVVMTSADQNFIHLNYNQMSNEKLPCTFIYDDNEVYYGASVRLKSSEHGRFNDSRVGYIIDFGGDELFLGTHGSIAIDRSGGLDSNQYEILIKQSTNAAGGIYASEDDIIRVIGTKTSYTGAALLSKSRLNSEFLNGQWPNGADGTLFKYERIYVETETTTGGPEGLKYPQDSTGPPGVNVGSLGTIAQKELYRWYWLIRNNREADNYSEIIPKLIALGQSGNTFLNDTAPLIDGSKFLRSLVPQILFGVVDSYGTNAQHNAIFYTPPGGKMIHIPWDLDFLGQGDSSASMTPNTEQQKYLVSPVWRRNYWGHVLDILDNSFNTEFLTKWATHYSKFGVSMTPTLSYLTARAAYARSQVTVGVPVVPFRITTAGPLNVATPTATVAGDGWINIANIRLQGSTSPLPVTWTDADSWSIPLPLRGGTRVYTLEALSTSGSVLGSASITITATPGSFPAYAGSLLVSEINYNPPGSGDLTEFLEILNITGDNLTLDGCHFDDENSEGIGYLFPAGVSLAPGARLLIVRDQGAMITQYGNGLPMAPGVFTGALSNSGESLVLYAANGTVIFRFAYNDNLASTDGNGRTLVRVTSSTNPDPNNFTWRESTVNGGNPGNTDAIPPFTGDPNADPDNDGYPALLEYAFGTSNTDPTSVPGPPTFTFLPDGTVQPAWPILANADYLIATIQTSTSLTNASWTTLTNPAGGPRRYFRLLLTPR
jgi:hypothetical protein